MIYGKNIYLRELIKDDIEGAHALYDEEEVLKYSYEQKYLDFNNEVTDKFKYLKRTSERSYVVVNNNGSIVGILNYRKSKYVDDVYVISIVIGKKYWRQGYGSEGVELILNYLFNRKKAHRVELEVVKENLAAINCYKKCGFVEEGIRREKYYYKGRYLDTILMGILEKEYKEKRSKK